METAMTLLLERKNSGLYAVSWDQLLAKLEPLVLLTTQYS